MGLLVVFRDSGLGIPSIALLLDFFSMKESAKGFLSISKRSNAKLIISDLPSSHKYWKERYFFVSGRHWEYNPFDWEDTLGVPAIWTTPENLLSSLLLWFNLVFRGYRALLTLPWLRGLQKFDPISVLKMRR